MSATMSETFDALTKVGVSQWLGDKFGVTPIVVKIVVMAVCFCFTFFGYFSDVVFLVLGYGYPMYMSFCALAEGEPDLVTRWLRYWVVFAICQVCETCCYYLIYGNSYHHLLRFIFVLWLVSSQAHGSERFYTMVIR